DYPDLSLAQFKRLMFESYLASTIISTYGKSPHLKIIQKIYNPQNEMLLLTKTKCIFSKNETSHDYSFYLIF
ncbi:MAG TPA: hypothetical protein DDY12_01560, partial [Porphyromonadaceae bacterium]|nr:hypothetical protein [Porphyromonadaceae bacterium]